MSKLSFYFSDSLPEFVPIFREPIIAGPVRVVVDWDRAYSHGLLDIDWDTVPTVAQLLDSQSQVPTLDYLASVQSNEESMCSNCGAECHHTEECIYSPRF